MPIHLNGLLACTQQTFFINYADSTSLNFMAPRGIAQVYITISDNGFEAVERIDCTPVSVPHLLRELTKLLSQAVRHRSDTANASGTGYNSESELRTRGNLRMAKVSHCTQSAVLACIDQTKDGKIEYKKGWEIRAPFLLYPHEKTASERIQTGIISRN
ncbi:hypothetical protein ACU8KH_05513 [Lachancea thermotolerans]